jgi:glycosyltransferase involved in cell wall biosynthesis
MKKTPGDRLAEFRRAKNNAAQRARLERLRAQRERIAVVPAKARTDAAPAALPPPPPAPAAVPAAVPVALPAANNSMCPKLTIMICSTSTRAGTFLPKMFAQLEEQTRGRTDVELLSIVDNKSMTVGRKRNLLLSMATGEYVVFVDDDDILEKTYVEDIVAATASGADVLCFDLMRYVSGIQDRVVHYSKEFKVDSNEPRQYKRIPNHIMCFKRSLAASVRYAELTFGEDSDWAKRMLPLIKSEHQIGKVLYRYMYNSATSEATVATQNKVLAKQRQKIDVVIPSLSKPELHKMIRECISSLRSSEPSIDFNVVVVESGPEKVELGQDATVMFDLPKFNFNHALKQGIAVCKSKWVVLANNDLVFHPGWMSTLQQFAENSSGIKSFSPWNPRSHPAHFRTPQDSYIGYEVTKHIAGWCLITTLDVLNTIQLSEEIEYWYSDNNYADELKKHGIVHALLRNSVVTHLHEQTTRRMDNKKQMTVDQKALYEKIKLS